MEALDLFLLGFEGGFNDAFSNFGTVTSISLMRNVWTRLGCLWSEICGVLEEN